MSYEFDARAALRMESYVSELGEMLGDKRRRGSFAAYTFGLMGTSARKSMEAMAATASGEPARCNAAHQRLQRLISESDWDVRPLRLHAARHAIAAMEKHEPISTWIIDDTGFLKQGVHSVGVQRQYTGSAGKITNCQIGVSLSVATSGAHVPIDFELYLPDSWTEDPARREKAKIPEDMTFRSKEDLALTMIERAAQAGIPGSIVLADSFYGRSSAFRDAVQLLGFDYALGIQASHTMWRLTAGEKRQEPTRHSAESIAKGLPPRRYRTLTWREGVSGGARGKLRSRFAFVRVAVPSDADPTSISKLWLLIEWPEGERKPTRYSLTSLPRRMSKKEIVRILKERYRTERVYEEMKGELGLDHFEGRSFMGWHHHVTVAMACYAFITAELVNAFPPSAARTRAAHALGAAA